MIVFEQEHGRHVWRLEATEWNGQPRLQFWPWFRDKESGELRPNAQRFGGGFAVPRDRLAELVEALQSVEQSEA